MLPEYVAKWVREEEAIPFFRRNRWRLSDLAEPTCPENWIETGAWRNWLDPPLNIVAGESHYQEAIARLAGPIRDRGWLVPVVVSFVREPGNPYDSKALRALVAGQGVGYLRRELAAQ